MWARGHWLGKGPSGARHCLIAAKRWKKKSLAVSTFGERGSSKSATAVRLTEKAQRV